MALAWAAARLGRARRARALARRRRHSNVEHRLDDHVFALIPAIWADIPAPVQPMPHRDDLEAPATGGEVSTAGDEDEDVGRSRLAAAAQPKKPTLH
jgi:hypothetical protein